MIIRLCILCLLAVLEAPSVGTAQWNGCAPGWCNGGGTSNLAVCTTSTPIIARMVSNGGAPNTTALGTLICGLVTDNVLISSATAPCSTFFDWFYVFTIDSKSSANIDFCNNNNATEQGGTVTFTANLGYVGVDGAVNGSYLQPGSWIASGPNFTKDAAHLATWSMTDETSANAAMGGTSIGGGYPQDVLYLRYNGDGKYYAILNDSTSNGQTVATGQGFYFANRTSSTNINMYKNTTLVAASAQTTTAVSNAALFPLLANSGLGGNKTGWGGTMGFASAGGTLSSGQITSLYNRLCTYFTTVHGSCP
jgi:hypothetical protein